jgi:hypothetical protein
MTNPREAEATATHGTFTFRDHEFKVPLDRDEWSVDFLEALEDGKAAGTVRGALGPKQWQTVKELDLKVKDLAELGDQIASVLGFGSAGESPASNV